jgi:parallel beta-helix repeat protein
MANILKLLIILISLFPTVSDSKIICVPKDVQSIQTAVDRADAGDTIFLLNGFYLETVTLKDNISLIGESISKTIIHGNGREPVIKAADKTLIKKCTIENGSTGIKCENTANIIEQVLIKDNKETGIHCLITLPNIRNCIIYRNAWTGIFCESTRSINTSIEHNIISENGYCGIKLSGRGEVLIINNVFLNNKEFGIWTSQESEKSRVIYNDFYGNRSAYNLYTRADRSNLHEDPGYSMQNDGVEYFENQPLVLKGKGKDGATVGIISEKDLTNKLTDPDGDKIYNDNDACPSIPEDIDGFEDDDGCPDFDNDNDGIYDTQDRCPDVPEDFDGFRDEDGCDDFDNDRDNIPDSKDVCPNDPETYNGYKDEDGCPDEVPAK